MRAPQIGEHRDGASEIYGDEETLSEKPGAGRNLRVLNDVLVGADHPTLLRFDVVMPHRHR